MSINVNGINSYLPNKFFTTQSNTIKDNSQNTTKSADAVSSATKHVKTNGTDTIQISQKAIDAISSATKNSK